MVFGFIYLGELIIKISAQGVAQWSRNYWNLFDAFINAGLFPMVFIRVIQVDHLIHPETLVYTIEVYFLDLLAIKLIGMVPILKSLFKTIISSGRAIGSTLGMLTLMFTGYALYA